MKIDDEIRKITSYKTWSVKRKTDTLLEMDAINYTNLGTDSTKTEKKNVKTISRKIYRAISIINPLDGYILEAHMNEKDLRSLVDAQK